MVVPETVAVIILEDFPHQVGLHTERGLTPPDTFGDPPPVARENEEASRGQVGSEILEPSCPPVAVEVGQQ
jgi:hypothetical protein